MLPANYQIRLVDPSQYEEIVEICRLVYPTETPYTVEELDDHRQVFPQGQFVAVETDLQCRGWRALHAATADD